MRRRLSSEEGYFVTTPVKCMLISVAAFFSRRRSWVSITSRRPYLRDVLCAVIAWDDRAAIPVYTRIPDTTLDFSRRHFLNERRMCLTRAENEVVLIYSHRRITFRWSLSHGLPSRFFEHEAIIRSLLGRESVFNTRSYRVANLLTLVCNNRRGINKTCLVAGA